MRRLLIAATLLASGCFGDADPLSLLNKLRVIDIRADEPEIAQGASTTLRVLAKDFSPLQESIIYSWAICHKAPVPGQGRAVHPDCLLNDTAPFLEPLPDGDTVTVTMPTFKSPLELGLPDQTGGFYLPIRMTARTATQRLVAVYRLRLSVFGTPNHNPVIAKIWREFDPPTPGAAKPAPYEIGESELHVVHNGENLKLRAEIPDSSLEPYTEVIGDPRDMNFQSTTEQITVRWHITAGELTQETTGERHPREGEDPITDEKKTTELKLYEKHAPLPGLIIDIYIVAYDGRGGSTSTMRTILFK